MLSMSLSVLSVLSTSLSVLSTSLSVLSTSLSVLSPSLSVVPGCVTRPYSCCDSLTTGPISGPGHGSSALYLYLCLDTDLDPDPEAGRGRSHGCNRSVGGGRGCCRVGRGREHRLVAGLTLCLDGLLSQIVLGELPKVLVCRP